MTPQTQALDATLDDGMFTTWEFKGIEIKPISYARKNHIVSIASGYPPGPTMFATCIYGAICPIGEIIKGLRNVDSFTERVTTWMDEIELEQDDYEELGRIYMAIMEHSGKNQAVPIESDDLSMTADPVGNL
jgi:hypothetical protein